MTFTKAGLQQKNDKCPICENNKNPVYYINTIGNTYFQCMNCSSIFIDNTAKIDPYPTEALSVEQQSMGFEKDLRSNKLWTYSIGYVKWLEEYIKNISLSPSPSVLSIGCAYGHDLHELSKRGWDVLGIDHDMSFTKRVQKQHGLNVLHGHFEDMEFDRQFDLVVLASVLPYFHDIRKVLRKINSITKKGGFVFISIRNVDGVNGTSVLSYPTNIYARQYFPQKSIQFLLEKFGFDTLAIDFFTIKQPLISHLSKTIRNILNKQFNLYDKLLNMNYIFWRLFYLNPFKSTTSSNGRQILILARKVKDN